MLVTLSDISKSFLDETVLNNISLSINENDRIGLLGMNGVGKSTLLNIITGHLDYDSGTMSLKKNLEIGYLKQNEALNSENTLDEEIKLSLKTVYDLKLEISHISNELSTVDTQCDKYKALSEKYDELNNHFIALDGFTADFRIKTVLNGLGFGDYDLSRKAENLSGGEKMRFAIAKMLLKNPELLILDEPTNHLDFATLSWLESYLNNYKGAVLIVSHDRYFLDRVVNNICELERSEIHRYKGGYKDFLKQKDERIKLLEKEYQKQQVELNEMRDYVSRNLAKSSSINSVGSRVKALEKMEMQEKPNPRQKKVKFKFEFDIEPHKNVLICKDVGVFVGNSETGKQLYNNISLEVLSGEKIAIVGKNGIGKTSLLKAILRKIPYDGYIRFGGNVKVAYFDQELANLNLNDTVIEAVHRNFPTKTEFEIRSALGSLLIEDEAVFKRVKDLSGANRAKVAFCIIMFQRANVLILDEPTNHLDYMAKEALDEALKEYSGTLITVSHDRYFLNNVPTKIIEMFENELVIYNGTYDYYIEHRKSDQQNISKPKNENSQKVIYEKSKENKSDDRKKRVKINLLQKDINSLSEEIENLKAISESPEIASDYQKITDFLEEINEKEKLLEEYENEWLELTL
ncbi:MAG: ABC-F family ATP-binding cassette domain-containing protein [Oscillospiraceae bacterium]